MATVATASRPTGPRGQELPPTPAQEFQRLKQQLHLEVVDSIDLSKVGQFDPDQLRREIRALAEQVCRSRGDRVSPADRDRMTDELLDDIFGLGPLEALIRDPDISDILVNGAREVYVERCGRLELTDIVFADEQHVLQIVQRAVERVGRRIDEVSPMVDAALPDGSRLNAIIRPVSRTGPVLSIRRFGHERVRFNQTIEGGSITREMVDFLHAMVLGRANILVCGGTGAGKTTMLNNLSHSIPLNERLVVIEATSELYLQQPHVVYLETRPPNVEGRGEITQRDLFRNSLRMRPDRIIIGDILGPEALDMLQAMNTGHEGSMSTIHANDTIDALARLELMVALSGVELPIPIVRQHVASALDLVIHLARLAGGARRLMKVSELVDCLDGRYVLEDIFCFKQTGLSADGTAIGDFHATGYRPKCLERMRPMGIDIPDSVFEKRVMTLPPAGTAPAA